jgi:hypothetical protein
MGTWDDGTAKKVELLSLSFTNLDGTAHDTALASNPSGESQQDEHNSSKVVGSSEGLHREALTTSSLSGFINSVLA